MIVTIDTNIIYQALYSNAWASYQILNLIINEKIQFALTTSVYFEYYDVLTRASSLNKFQLKRFEIETILDLLALLSKKFSVYYLLRPNLIDENDNMFFECAFVSASQFLITSNTKHFEKRELNDFGFEIVTPSIFYNFWKRNHGK